MAEFTNEKILPQSLEAEQAVLAAMFNDKDAILEVIPILKETDFYRHDHGVLYATMRNMNEQGVPIDLVTITAQLEKAGGITYVAQIANSIGSASNIVHYANIVKEKAVLRDLITISGNIANRSYDDAEDTEKILDDAERMVLEISQKRARSGLTPVSEVIDNTLTTLEILSQKKEGLTGVTSGFIDLDKREDKNDQIITYARHNNGRTVVVIANKNPNRNLTGTIKIPGLKSTQDLVNMAPKYGEESRFQVVENEIRVDLAPSSAYIFEIDTPNIENDRKGNVFKQKV